MTDKEKIISLFKEFGVGMDIDEKSITLTEGASKVTGYNGFVTIFEFSEEGMFVSVGAWE